jgi:hypothetical protein
MPIGSRVDLFSLIRKNQQIPGDIEIGEDMVGPNRFQPAVGGQSHLSAKLAAYGESLALERQSK